MMRVGLIGAGVMGSMIARAIDDGRVSVTLAAVTDLTREKTEALCLGLQRSPRITNNIAELLALSDLVVEAASPQAVSDIVPLAVSENKDVLVLSVGGLIDHDDWIRQAERKGTRIHCPSGAIAGLDAVKAAAIGRIHRATITTRKPPEALFGAPHLADGSIDLGNLQGALKIFEGSAREACRAFPANINVSAALSLAGIGVDQTHVTIIADPSIQRNIHRIEVEGEFGRLETVTENAPSENPRTSRLAALSAIALLKDISGAFRVGT